MKKVLFLFAFVCLCGTIFAQKAVETIRYEGVLAQVITQERYQRLLTEAPSKLVVTYFEATQCGYVTNQLPENVVVMGDICQFVSPNAVCDDAATVVRTKQLNPRNYALTREEVRHTAYAIGSTGYYYVLYPIDVVNKKYAAFMKEYGF